MILPDFTCGKRIRHMIEHEVDISREQILQRRSRAAIGNIVQLHADEILEIDPRDVSGAAGADAADRDLVLVGFTQGRNSFRSFAGTPFFDTSNIG